MTKRILKVLGKSHALEILESLSEKPMRFVDLKEVCKSNRTRTVRLKELKEEGLIRALPKLSKDRAYTFYEITLKGKRTLKLVEKIVNLSSDEEKVQS
jgi:DNA-binding HxlR family transcriptional regulator